MQTLHDIIIHERFSDDLITLKLMLGHCEIVLVVSSTCRMELLEFLTNGM